MTRNRLTCIFLIVIFGLAGTWIYSNNMEKAKNAPVFADKHGKIVPEYIYQETGRVLGISIKKKVKNPQAQYRLLKDDKELAGLRDMFR